MPPAAEWLVKLKYGTRGQMRAGSEQAVQALKTQVHTMLVATATTVLLAPMAAVFVLDESCLRYYLSFAPDLKKLLDTWNIGQQGVSAYRAQFCGRQLITEFSYGVSDEISTKFIFKL